MKSTISIQAPAQSRSTVPSLKALFSWAMLAKLYSRILPSFLGFDEATPEDARMISAALLFVPVFFALVACCVVLLHIIG